MKLKIIFSVSVKKNSVIWNVAGIYSNDNLKNYYMWDMIIFRRIHLEYIIISSHISHWSRLIFLKCQVQNPQNFTQWVSNSMARIKGSMRWIIFLGCKSEMELARDSVFKHINNTHTYTHIHSHSHMTFISGKYVSKPQTSTYQMRNTDVPKG